MIRMIQVVRRWSVLVFGDHSQQITPRIRMLRLVEEVMEGAQSEGVPDHEIDTIKKQVYSRPANPDPRSELGGIMVTLMAYCATREYDPGDAFWTEFERIMDPAMMDKVRRRNLSGDKIGMEA